MTSQSEITLSSPRWGGNRKQHHVGGAALMAFSLLLWALFLGTVGAPIDRAADGHGAVAIAR